MSRAYDMITLGREKNSFFALSCQKQRAKWPYIYSRTLSPVPLNFYRRYDKLFTAYRFQRRISRGYIRALHTREKLLQRLDINQTAAAAPSAIASNIYTDRRNSNIYGTFFFSSSMKLEFALKSRVVGNIGTLYFCATGWCKIK